VHVVTRRKLQEAAKDFRDASKEISAWLGIVEAVRWRNFNQVRLMFPDADAVDGYMVFNIRGNRYRLITVIHYAKDEAQGHIYIRSFLRHAEYNDKKKWDPFAA
jgi:mRNA interferase HigB